MATQKSDHPAHCTFCELIQGSAEVSICHEDSDAIAFMDIQPVNDGHVLVVPREHHESLLDVPEELGVHLFKVTMRLANAIRQVTGCDDMNIVVNSGAAAGQDEPHYHVHIIPRRVGDGFDIPLPFNGSNMPDRTVLDANAARIISALRDPMRTQQANANTGANERGASSVQRDVSESTHAVSRGTSAHGSQSAGSRDGERELDVQVFSENGADLPAPGSAEAEGERVFDTWQVDEGAHGELRYEPPSDAGAH